MILYDRFMSLTLLLKDLSFRFNFALWFYLGKRLLKLSSGDVMGRNSLAVGFEILNGSRRHRYSFDLKWGEGKTLSYIGSGMACYGGLKTSSANPTNITRVSV